MSQPGTAENVVPIRRPAPRPASRARPVRKPIVPNNVLGMVVFVMTEVMFFSGLVSAYIIGEGQTAGGWPPPGQPRLPIEGTALNSVALLLSGVALFLAGRALKAGVLEKAGRLFLAAIILGAVFVVVQGIEWVGLISEGLTLTYSTHGSFFYLIIGLHAVHAVAALGGLGWAFGRFRRGELATTTFTTVQVFWTFVVGVWPVLYLLVYL
jgi:heme/copper-type cytochrome/quinol oxidase subunit 3